MAEGYDVEVDQPRAHAVKVAAIQARFEAVTSAGAHIGQDDQAYGLLCGWISGVLDQVTQQGPPVKGPYLTKDANGNPAWAYDYKGTVDGVEVKTTVLADGEIRTAYPPNGADPGVITNPSAPNPAPSGVPVSNPPR